MQHSSHRLGSAKREVLTVKVSKSFRNTDHSSKTHKPLYNNIVQHIYQNL